MMVTKSAILAIRRFRRSTVGCLLLCLAIRPSFLRGTVLPLFSGMRDYFYGTGVRNQTSYALSSAQTQIRLTSEIACTEKKLPYPS